MLLIWCPRPDSNRYGFITRGILSPLRLPFRHSGTKLLVPRVRLELTTPWLKVKCSTTELTEGWLGWLGSDQCVRESKSLALPLGYTPTKVVGEDGFEPPNPKELIYSQPRLATSLFAHDPNCCVLFAHILVVDAAGFEPATPAL